MTASTDPAGEVGLHGIAETEARCYSCQSEPCLCGVQEPALSRREEALADCALWWRSEWKHKNQEAEWLWRVCFALAFLCGACFFIGTVLG